MSRFLKKRQLSAFSSIFTASLGNDWRLGARVAAEVRRRRRNKMNRYFP